MRAFASILLCVLLFSGLSACLPEATPLPPLPTDTPSQPTSTPTATVVWFPPTPTFTPFPTPAITPTVDLRPQVGELLLEDNFDSSRAWTLGQFAGGSAALGKNELTLAVTQERGYVSSVRSSPDLGNFYAEITASPSLCRGMDEYGLLVRVASPQDFYRFSLSCDGQARLDRILSGQASSPQPWTITGSVPPGAPSTSRLAVSAIGKEMRFFVNGEFLFSVDEPSIPSGNLGVFARATADPPVTVNFSDLQVYRVSP